MKQKIRNIFGKVFGVEENIIFKITLSFLIISIIFFLFMINSPKNSNEFNFFTLAFDVCFAMWIIMSKGVDSASKFFIELARGFIFLTIFLFSLYFFCFFDQYHGYQVIIYTILSCLGLFASLFYFTSIFFDIFNIFKKIFKIFKTKIFNSIELNTNKFTSFISNITAFLAAIGAFVLAVKGIIEPMVKLFANT